jgi:parvulin-like peptidyl-prolyl isomerase
LSTQYQEWLNTLADSADLDEATYRNIIRAVILRDKLREAIGDEAPTSAEQTHARHILVETEEEAQDIRERIEAGEDFADLAAEVSLDTGSGAQGGDLGFVPQGRFVPTIDEAVFSLPIGELSEPIESDFGWHLVEVFEREERELLASDYAQSQRTAFTDWLSEARVNADVEDFWTPELAPGE